MKKHQPKQSPAQIAASAILSAAVVAGFVYIKWKWPSNPPPTTAAEPAAEQVAVAASDTVPSGPRWTLNPLKEPIAEDFERYDRLLARLGFKAGTAYSVREFYEMMRRRKIGDAGQYEDLKCAVHHDSTNRDDLWRAMSDNVKLSKKRAWEMTYYKNIDQTWIVGDVPDGVVSQDSKWIIKVAKGRRPDLNVE